MGCVQVVCVCSNGSSARSPGKGPGRPNEGGLDDPSTGSPRRNSLDGVAERHRGDRSDAEDRAGPAEVDGAEVRQDGPEGRRHDQDRARQHGHA